MSGIRLVQMSAVIFLALRAAAAQEASESVRLRAENGVLRSEIERRDKEIATLKAENAQLARQVAQFLELCHKAGVAVPELTSAQDKERPSTPPRDTYAYLGTARSRAWFDTMYERFSDKIAFVDGRYMDIGKDMLALPEIKPMSPCVGACGRTPGGCKVLQIVGANEVLVARPETVANYGLAPTRLTVRYPELLFHVKGLDTRRLVDGGAFESTLVCIGTYRYAAVGGREKTIASYAVHQPLSRGQFAEALAGGFRLVEYRRVRRTEPKGAVGTTQKRAHPKSRGVRAEHNSQAEVTEIVSTPVP